MIGTKNKPGFSLMEVLVSVALFSIIVLSSTEIFSLVIKGQREAIASQNVQESLKYFFEVTGKEIRMARRDDGSCADVVDGQIFTISSNSLGNVLNFQNYYGECVSYALVEAGGVNRWQISRNIDSGYISPAKINIENLQFTLNTTGQPVVTISLFAYAIGEQKEASGMEIQTSITSRYYRN